MLPILTDLNQPIIQSADADLHSSGSAPLGLSRQILTDLNSREHFAQLLQNNPGLLVIKFGATWCGPCKKIEGLVHSWFDKMPDTVQCMAVDVDDCFEVYAFLKSKKMVNGIPAILCYEKGNVNYIPNDIVIGADNGDIDKFFNRCLQLCNVKV